jgi:hypothetical protein
MHSFLLLLPVRSREQKLDKRDCPIPLASLPHAMMTITSSRSISQKLEEDENSRRTKLEEDENDHKKGPPRSLEDAEHDAGGPAAFGSR